MIGAILRGAMGAAHVAAVVTVAGAICLCPVPLIAVVALWPRRIDHPKDHK